MGQQHRRGRRRRMLKFSIREISAVDRPAQEGARALLLKRDGGAATAREELAAAVAKVDRPPPRSPRPSLPARGPEDAAALRRRLAEVAR